MILLPPINEANGKLSQLINKGELKVGQLKSERNKVRTLVIDNECAAEVRRSLKQCKLLAK